MISLILSRLGQSLLTLIALVSVVFVLVRMKPGNPFQDEKAVPAHVMEKINEKYGFAQTSTELYLIEEWNLPPKVAALERYGEQYVKYWFNLIFRFDLGPCLKLYQGFSVGELIEQSFPYSLILGLFAMVYALGVGIPLGVVAALYKNTWIDYGTMLIAMLGICIPVFVSGPLFQVLVATKVPFIRTAGMEGVSDLIIPAIALGLGVAAYVARLTRGGMLEVLSLDYVRTAKAKGLPMSQIVIRHCLRGALMPVISYIGPAFAAITTGSFVIESVFQIPGMGQHFVKGVTGNEIFIVQGLALFYGVIIMGANLFSDLLQVWLNPQLRKDLVK